MDPLIAAVEMENKEELLQLLAVGYGLNYHEGEGGFTPLMWAIDAEVDGATQTGEPLSDDMTRFLLDHGADPSFARRDGMTPLEYARRRGHVLAERLISERLSRDG